MWIILLVTLLTIWFLYSKWKYSYWSSRDVPNPKPFLFCGNFASTFLFRKALGEVITEWYNDYKTVPYFGIYRGFQPAIVLRDPDLIKDVLIKDFPSFSANDIPVDDSADPFLAYNPLVLKDDAWKRSRVLLAPLFTSSKVKSIYSNMEFACNNLVSYLRKQSVGQDFDSKTLSVQYSTENIVKCAFSLDAKCFEDEPSEFRDIGKEMFQISPLLILKFMLLPMVPTWITNLISLPIVAKRAENWFLGLVKENRESRENVVMENWDLMQLLYNQGKKMDASKEELASHALGIFFDGFETSGLVLSYVFYELAKRPDIQQNLYQEIVTVRTKYGNVNIYEAVQEMSYLDCIIQETLRLNAPNMIFVKLCTKEYILPRFGYQKEGVKVKPGTAIYIPVHGLHYDPEYYPDPNVFKPERFDIDERQNRHKANFIPFGEGPRMCMGMRFATAQVKAAVIAVIQEFQITLSPNHKPFELDPASFVYQPKHGILLNFSARSTA